jgi:hypothetical protein
MLIRCRLAHRLRDMQTLPYVVVTNPHISHVYELYYKAFETLRRVPEVKSVKENDAYCRIISGTLKEHLTVIPRLAMGVLECQDLMQPAEMDKFMNTVLRSVSQYPEHDLLRADEFIANIETSYRRAAPRSNGYILEAISSPRR